MGLFHLSGFVFKITEGGLAGDLACRGAVVEDSDHHFLIAVWQIAVKLDHGNNTAERLR